MSKDRAQTIFIFLAGFMVVLGTVCLAINDLADAVLCVLLGFGYLWISEQL